MNAKQVVYKLLEVIDPNDPDDPEAFVNRFEPSPLNIVMTAHERILALPHADLGEFYPALDRIIHGMLYDLEQTTGREGLNGLDGLLRTYAPLPWMNPPKKPAELRKSAKYSVTAFKSCSRKVK